MTATISIAEALDLREVDLEPARGALLVREGKGGRRREVGMDAGVGSDCGHGLISAAHAGGAALLRDRRSYARQAVGRAGGADTAPPPRRQAGVRRRFAPHQLRHTHAVEMAREGVPLNVIQLQLGHAKLRVTSVYLLGIDSEEIIKAVHARRAPMMPAGAGLTG